MYVVEPDRAARRPRSAAQAGGSAARPALAVASLVTRRLPQDTATLVLYPWVAPTIAISADRQRRTDDPRSRRRGVPHTHGLPAVSRCGCARPPGSRACLGARGGARDGGAWRRADRRGRYAACRRGGGGALAATAAAALFAGAAHRCCATTPRPKCSPSTGWLWPPCSGSPPRGGPCTAWRGSRALGLVGRARPRGPRDLRPGRARRAPRRGARRRRAGLGCAAAPCSQPRGRAEALLSSGLASLAADTAVSWGTIDSLQALVRHFLREDYGGPGAFSPRGGELAPLRQLAVFASELGRQWVWLPVAAGLVALGAQIAQRSPVRPSADTEAGPVAGRARIEPRAGWIALLAAFVLAGPLLVARFDVFPAGLNMYALRRFYLLPALLLAPAVALALEHLVRRGSARLVGGRAATILVALVATVGLAVVAAPSLSYVRRTHSPALQKALEKHSGGSHRRRAVLIHSQGAVHYGIGYLQVAEACALDVTAVSVAAGRLRVVPGTPRPGRHHARAAGARAVERLHRRGRARRGPTALRGRHAGEHPVLVPDRALRRRVRGAPARGHPPADQGGAANHRGPVRELRPGLPAPRWRRRLRDGDPRVLRADVDDPDGSAARGRRSRTRGARTRDRRAARSEAGLPALAPATSAACRSSP